MKQLFDQVSYQCSKMITRSYSTSFSLGIHFLHKSLHDGIYAIYGFVRLADEIVDSFHAFDKKVLMHQFRTQCEEAIETRISLNPVLNSFQLTVHRYQIEWSLIDTFLKSMEMDLDQSQHDQQSFETYILGSAEVVGLMCLRVFTHEKPEQYDILKPMAMKLGSAFQKVNFLRDIQADYEQLGRTYFPGVDFTRFTQKQKLQIQADIEKDFREALVGIRQLPSTSRLGVYLAYVYYKKLFQKIQNTPAEEVLQKRIRIPNIYKIGLLFQSMLRLKLNLW